MGRADSAAQELQEQVGPYLAAIDISFALLIGFTSARPWTALLVLLIPMIVVPMMRRSARGRPVRHAHAIALGVNLPLFGLAWLSGPNSPAWLPAIPAFLGLFLAFAPGTRGRVIASSLVLSPLAGSYLAGKEWVELATICLALTVMAVIGERVISTLQAQVRTSRVAHARLDAANRELQQFVYVASHDLKAPVRAMANLADWVRDDLHGFEVPEEVDRNLELLVGRAQRLSRLIDGIVDYSKAGVGSSSRQLIDTAALVRRVVHTDLECPAGFTVHTEAGLPRIVGDSAPLRRVLGELIGNAIVHHGDDEGTVRVGARTLDEAWVEFHVSDDGQGIPDVARERIFAMFQTVVRRDEFEMTGVGLALVHKLVHAAGGRVWVEPAGAKGSVFRFTWPTGCAAAA